MPELVAVKGLLLSMLLVVPIVLSMAVGAVIGLATENYRIKRFHQQLEEGKHLLMVDAFELDKIRHALPQNCKVADSGADQDTRDLPFDEPHTEPLRKAS